MQAEVVTWPGGEHAFRLALAQLEGLQQKTDAGPEWLAMRLRSGQWLATEAFEILRWGLIGGGMKADAANRSAEGCYDPVTTSITWPGGVHPFRLDWPSIRSFELSTGSGLEWLAMRLRSGQWLATEAFEVLRWGLIGGGLSENEAKKSVSDAFDRHHVGAFKTPAIAVVTAALYGNDEHPNGVAAFKVPALTVIMAALYGPPDDEVGKPSLAGETTPNSESGDAGSSAPSTD